MDFQLRGKRALVTGASSGLGAAIATLLAREGAEVVVHGRNEERTSLVVKAIRDEEGAATAVTGNLDTDEEADAVAGAALADGHVDILVNNVGYFEPQRTWSDLTSSGWADIYNVNVLSSVRLIRRLVPPMRERRWGRVIQISSVTGLLPTAAQPHYGATNAARDYLSRSLSRELGETGVTANTVAPGGILTDAGKDTLVEFGRANTMGNTWDEMETAVVHSLAPNDIGRIARLEEVGSAVVYLASPVANYLTGTTIRLDGNWYLPARRATPLPLRPPTTVDTP
ncbi:3-oxoacyl-ACP reductase [Actinomycetospora sp. NBRC 106375]|uniref:SDR family NAD(P)-dependent oxidoreductase n=1 Tax=Actinomycetospora sp. NBRC 106375 TaxID=3032207 RepID=UPI00249FC5D3|nr:SDR family NAD(P)-dependent oxidoreductase [Actinomycetospora sp. NBRC 106375]GLZ48859.1 3-oxoacyl-ACP reductase [Actinomycetospora sp. NBRC 106375]